MVESSCSTKLHYIKKLIKLYTKGQGILVYMIVVWEFTEVNQLSKPLLKTLRDCADRSSVGKLRAVARGVLIGGWLTPQLL